MIVKILTDLRSVNSQIDEPGTKGSEIIQHITYISCDECIVVQTKEETQLQLHRHSGLFPMDDVRVFDNCEDAHHVIYFMENGQTVDKFITNKN